MGFDRIFWKNNVQEAYLSKMSISGQIVSEIVAQLCLETSIQTLTAVASMRRTEALASVKFYQILSIFIFLSDW